MTDVYSKIGAPAVANKRSKSVDFLDLLRPLRSDQHSNPCWNFEAPAECCDDEINGESFGMVLCRRHSVSSPADPRKEFHLESKKKWNSAVKGLLSMKRSTQLSERYYRIHDQSQSPTAYFLDEDSMEDETESMEPKPVEKQQQQRKGGNIIKACKRFFNLK